MIPFLRVVRLLAIVLWVGGLCFFAFVVAPVAFGVLPSKHEAGMVVAGTLGVLNWIGFGCFFAFLLGTSGLISRADQRMRRLLAAEMVLLSLMALATLEVQFHIVPRMERDRVAAGGDVDAAAEDNPARMDFERLHPVSEKVEGAALFLGLGVVVVMGFEGGAVRKDEAAQQNG